MVSTPGSELLEFVVQIPEELAVLDLGDGRLDEATSSHGSRKCQHLEELQRLVEPPFGEQRTCPQIAFAIVVKMNDIVHMTHPYH
jgi:hypothetical protein